MAMIIVISAGIVCLICVDVCSLKLQKYKIRYTRLVIRVRNCGCGPWGWGGGVVRDMDHMVQMLLLRFLLIPLFNSCW